MCFLREFQGKRPKNGVDFVFQFVHNTAIFEEGTDCLSGCDSTMKIIDRYLLFQFFKTLVLWFASFVGVYVIFDLFTNMEELVSVARDNGGILPVLGKYYFFKTFLFFDSISSMLVVLSAMVTIAWIQRHNELAALMAAGISQLRVVAPIIAAAVGVTFLAMASRELVMPKYRDELVRTPQNFTGKKGMEMKATYDYQRNIYLQGDRTFRNEKRISDPNFILPRQVCKYGHYLQAENAYFQFQDEHHPPGYLLDGVREPTEILREPTITLDDQPLIITPESEPEWLEEDQCFVVTDVSFNHLAESYAWREYSSTAELIQGVWNPSLKLGPEVYTAIHSRFVRPFLDIALLFLGLPIILSKSDRNVFKAMGISAGLVIGFIALQIASNYFGTTYEVPTLGAWLPLLMVVPVVVYLIDQINS